LSNYRVDGSDLTSVADAIRAKSGGSSPLAFPAEFVSEIGAIPSGGGGYSFDWADVTEVTIGANSVSNTQGVVNFFSTYAPYALIVLASALTTNNQFVSSHNSNLPGSNWIQRWRNGGINVTTVGSNYDCFLPQGSKYLVFVKK
jgi:hypothetical protein